MDLQSKSMDWFLYDSHLCYERVNLVIYIVEWCDLRDLTNKTFGIVRFGIKKEHLASQIGKII